MDVLKNVPRAELAWLAERGTLHTIEVGGSLIGKDGPIDHMRVIFEGHASLYAPSGASGGARRKIIEAQAGQVLGLLPYSRLQRSPGETEVDERITMFQVHRDHLAKMPTEVPQLTTALVHHMLDRAREFRSAQMIDDRLQSLGRLASGLAHELNNPASAAARHARSLPVWLDESER